MTKLVINEKQSNAIKLIRAISALMIVWCHIFQGLDNELAWWFNVGVQIFLFMSGFLMAKDYIANSIIFLKKRLLKILTPYYILLAITFIVYSMFNIDINLNNILTYIFCLQGITYKNIIPGLEHLWFMSIIIISYLLTLILNSQREKIINGKCGYVVLISFLILTQIIVDFSSLPTAFGARIGAFILGYFIACKYKYTISNKLLKNISILTIITLLIRIYFTYIDMIEYHEFNNIFNKYFVNWQHTLLGCFIFITLYYLFNLNQFFYEKKINVLNFISEYSYEIFLVHQVIIIGPLSILFLTNSLIVNIVLIFIIVTIVAVIIYELSRYLKNFKNKKC